MKNKYFVALKLFVIGVIAIAQNCACLASGAFEEHWMVDRPGRHAGFENVGYMRDSPGAAANRANPKHPASYFKSREGDGTACLECLQTFLYDDYRRLGGSVVEPMNRDQAKHATVCSAWLSRQAKEQEIQARLDRERRLATAQSIAATAQSTAASLAQRVVILEQQNSGLIQAVATLQAAVAEQAREMAELRAMFEAFRDKPRAASPKGRTA